MTKSKITWAELTEKQLESIAVNGNAADLDKDQLNALLEEAGNLSHVHFKRTYSKVLATSALMTTAFYSIDGWSVVIYLASEAAVALSPLIVFLGPGIGLGIGCWLAYDTHRDYKQKRDSIINSWKLADLRSYALDKLLNGRSPEQKKLRTPFVPNPEPVLKESIYFGSKNAILTCITAATVCYLFQTLGYISVVSLLAWPVGVILLASALVATVCMAAFFTHQHYKMEKILYRAEENRREADYVVEGKRLQYEKLKEERRLEERLQRLESTAGQVSTHQTEEKPVAASVASIQGQEGQQNMTLAPNYYQRWVSNSTLLFRRRSPATRKLDAAVETGDCKKILSEIGKWRKVRELYSDRLPAVDELERDVNTLKN